MSIEVDSLSLKIITEGAQASSALTGLASALDKLASKASNIKNANSALSSLQRTLEKFSRSDYSGLTETSEALERISSVKVPKLGALASELNALRKVKIDGVAEKIHEIGEAIGQLNAYAGNTALTGMLENLAAISARSSRAASALRQTASAAREVQQAHGTATPSGDVTPNVDEETSSAMERLKAAGREIASTFRSTVGVIRHPIKSLGSAFDSAKSKAIALKQAGVEHTLNAIAKAAEFAAHPIKSVKSAIGSVASKAVSLAKSGASAAFKALGRAARSALHPVQSIKSALSKIPVIGKAFGTITSFLKLAKFRVMRMALTSIFNGINESFKSLYQYGGQFASSMDSITTSTKYLSNSIVAALAPAINALAPIIDSAVDKFVSFLNIINQLIATLTGGGSWTKAVKVPQKYDDSLSSAASSAKELKRTLLSFDEINRLDSPSSASGGGASSGTDASLMFETQALSSDFRKRIEELDFESVGRMIAEKINRSVASLQERSVNLGASLAKYIQYGIDALYGFVDKLDWKGIGAYIGDNVNGFFTGISWSKAAQSLYKGVIGIFDMLRATVNRIDWGKLGTDIGTFICNIDWIGIALSIFNTVYDLGVNIAVGIINGIGSVFLGIGRWIKRNIFDPFVEGMKDIFGIHSPASNPQIVSLGKNIIMGVFNGVIDWMGNIRSWVNNHILQPVRNAINCLGDVTLTIVNTFKNKASDLWNRFKAEWGANDAKVSVKSELTKSGSSMLSEFKQGWGNPTLPIKASVSSQIRVKDLISSESASLAIKNSATKQQIGTFTVMRMAKGGIISAETLFPGGVLAGEAGKEAIIPLEQNTGWLDKLADRLVSKLSGTSGGDGQPVNINVTVTLDGRVVGESTVKYIRSEARAGRDPLGAYI